VTDDELQEYAYIFGKARTPIFGQQVAYIEHNN
jgi:hypothetical protein